MNVQVMDIGLSAQHGENESESKREKESESKRENESEHENDKKKNYKTISNLTFSKLVNRKTIHKLSLSRL